MVPVAHGDGLRERIAAAAPDGVDAFVDTHGDGYVALAVELGVAPERIDTIADFAAIEKFGVRGDGSAAGASADVLAELADLIQTGELDVPIAATYPLARGPRGLHGAGPWPHPRQDRAAAMTDAMTRAGTALASPPGRGYSWRCV